MELTTSTLECLDSSLQTDSWFSRDVIKILKSRIARPLNFYPSLPIRHPHPVIFNNLNRTILVTTHVTQVGEERVTNSKRSAQEAYMKLFLMIVPRVSFHCTIVPVHYQEYEYALLLIIVLELMYYS